MEKLAAVQRIREMLVKVDISGFREITDYDAIIITLIRGMSGEAQSRPFCQ
jgi:hypothetical protein